MKNLLVLTSLLFFVSCQTDSMVMQQKADNNHIKKFRIENSPTSTPTPQNESQDIEQKVGVVDFNKDKNVLCFRTTNDELQKDTPIQIVDSLYQPPQKWLSAKIKKKLEKSCINGDSDAGDENPEIFSFYSLDLAGDHNGLISIGIIDPKKKAKVDGNFATLDLDGDGKNEYFRNCTSMEGTHLTIWTGKPLKGKRIWHYYYYLGYDTVSSCKKADYE